MNNYNFTQSLDGLNNIEAETITASNASFSSLNNSVLSNCDFVNCSTSTTPVNNNSIVNKIYADSNFMFKTGSVTESITGNKTFSGSLISNNLTADNITGTQNIFANNTTGNINIGTGQTTGIINIGANQTTGVVNIGSATSQTQIKSVLRILDLNGTFGVRLQLSQVSGVSNYNSYAGGITPTTHNFFSYNNTGQQKKGFVISYSAVQVEDGLVFNCRQIRTTGASNPHELFTGMTTGTLTMGSLTSFIINNSKNTLNAQHTFNNFAPISNTAPTNPSHLTTKAYVDGMPVHQILNSSNVWTGTNSFNTYLPTSTLTPSNPTDITTKAYVDGMPIHGVLNSNNIWGGTNSFNTYLPTSTLTPSNPADLTTKSFTDATYQTIANMSSYLTTATASTTYLTITAAASTYQTIAGMASYLTTSAAASTYLTITAAASTYQTIAGMSSYLTNTAAASTYQTIANMSSYLTIATASSTYQTIANMSNYLTTTAAASTYQTIANMSNYANLSSSNTFTNINTFNGAATYVKDVRFNDVGGNGNYNQLYLSGTSLEFVPSFGNNSYRFYCKDSVPTQTTPLLINSSTTTISNALSITGLATFSNGAVFNTTLPTSTISASSPNQFTIKSFTDATYQTIANMSSYLTTAAAASTYLTITNAASTYQTIANMSNYLTTATASSTYLTISAAVSTYQTIANMSSYLTNTVAASTYLTITNAVSTYQTIAGMSNYLTTTAAASTYQTISGMSSYLTNTVAASTYLTITNAASTYQTIANMSNYLTNTVAASTYLTIATASSTYQTISGMSSYLTNTVAASTYLTITNATSTYQTIAGMSSYLTTTAAASTYQTISGMSSYLTNTVAASTYLTITNAASTYQTIANMSNYLTTSAAASTYQTIANMSNYVNTSTAQNISGDKTFNGYIKTKQGLWLYDVMYPYTNFMELSLIGTAMQFVPSFNSNSYQIYTNDSIGTTHIPVTITDASTTLEHQLICNNGAVFNNVLPTSSLTPSSPSELTTKTYVDSTFHAIVVGSIIQMAMGTVPTGYLACNGGSYSSSTYPALSAFLNFTYGGSAPSGMFQVPDFRGMFLRGAGTNGIDSAYASAGYGSLQTDGIKSHTHGIDFGFLTTASGGGSQNAYNSTSPNYNNPGTGSGRATGITTSNNNPYPDTRPGNFAVLFCIKF